ncbi:MAG: serine/threonine-protein phosphatase [Clostridiales Family XIII bacterium]|jgi:sigma-B regulation protein RsbU (phosphoserine phosphatase)|nr:serine/threonine-protein phosphatase [Clostridiales Family XIII bacterium]
MNEKRDETGKGESETERAASELGIGHEAENPPESVKEGEPDTEKLLASMADAMINPVMILTEDREILYINRIMEATFGNLVGRNAGILFLASGEAENDDGAYDRAVGAIRRSDGVVEVKIADVDYRLIETAIPSGENKYLAVMLEDISEKKIIENKANAHFIRYNTDVNMAGQIQESILPDNGEYWGLIQLHSIYLPAEKLSGDTYDVIKLNDDEALIYIADVSGHGIQASLLTMFINEKVRANAELASEGLDVLLAEILRGYKALGIDASVYITMLCCRYSRSRGELSIANAGHNCYPLILRKSGRTEEAPVRGMPISAISDENAFEEEIIGIAPGDRLLLYTDGIIEEYSRAEKSAFGSEGVRRIAAVNAKRDVGELARSIIAEASKYTIIAAKDDRTLLVAEFV